jgi:hypothetical protein
MRTAWARHCLLAGVVTLGAVGGLAGLAAARGAAAPAASRIVGKPAVQLVHGDVDDGGVTFNAAVRMDHAFPTSTKWEREHFSLLSISPPRNSKRSYVSDVDTMRIGNPRKHCYMTVGLFGDGGEIKALERVKDGGLVRVNVEYGQLAERHTTGRLARARVVSHAADASKRWFIDRLGCR